MFSVSVHMRMHDYWYPVQAKADQLKAAELAHQRAVRESAATATKAFREKHIVQLPFLSKEDEFELQARALLDERVSSIATMLSVDPGCILTALFFDLSSMGAPSASALGHCEQAAGLDLGLVWYLGYEISGAGSGDELEDDRVGV